MQFHLHADYVKAAAPREHPHAWHEAEARRAAPPPRRVRAHVARGLAVTARRLDGESARRALV